jgi:hypothetical protein
MSPPVGQFGIGTPATPGSVTPSVPLSCELGGVPQGQNFVPAATHHQRNLAALGQVQLKSNGFGNQKSHTDNGPMTFNPALTSITSVVTPRKPGIRTSRDMTVSEP